MNLRDWSRWCHHCDELPRNCNCTANHEAELKAHRTSRLLRAIDLVEWKIEALEDKDERDPNLPYLREKLNNLTKALVINRKIA